MSAQADDSDSATSDMDEKTVTVGRRCLVVDMLRATNGRIAELEVNGITDWSARPPSKPAPRQTSTRSFFIQFIRQAGPAPNNKKLLHQFIHQ